jgi:hypothetical protein
MGQNQTVCCLPHIEGWEKQKQMSLLAGEKEDCFFVINRTDLSFEEVFYSMKSEEMLKITSKKPNMICQLDAFCSNPFGPTEPPFI